jgi:hypothetical protein
MNILKTYPYIFNYKSIRLNITEKEDGTFILEIMSKTMIHTSYIPNSSKGNKLQAKIKFIQGECLGKRENGVSMHITLNAEYGWFCSLVEVEDGVTIEFYTGGNQFLIDHTISSVNHVNMYVLTAQLPK